MNEWCAQHGAQAIVTAHTANDQAETFLMRLARGSGVDGLSGMLRETSSPWPVVRPLLGFTRQDLQDVLGKAGHDWIEDPSNEDLQFERIRVRQALKQLEPLGIDASSIGLSMSRLARAREALDAVSTALIETALTCHDTGYGELDAEVFAEADAEVRLRVLQKLIWQFGNHDLPKMAALERIVTWLEIGEGRARTVSGCRIGRRKHVIVFGREPGRICAAPVTVTENDLIWDRRFRLRVERCGPPNDLAVVPLSALQDSENRLIRDAAADIPAFVRQGLPVVLQNGEMHCVPHIGVYGPGVERRISVNVAFIGLPGQGAP